MKIRTCGSEEKLNVIHKICITCELHKGKFGGTFFYRNMVVPVQENQGLLSQHDEQGVTEFRHFAEREHKGPVAWRRKLSFSSISSIENFEILRFVDHRNLFKFNSNSELKLTRHSAVLHIAALADRIVESEVLKHIEDLRKESNGAHYGEGGQSEVPKEEQLAHFERLPIPHEEL